MPELTMSVQVNRYYLGLSNLEINDHVNYFVAAQFLGGNSSYQRNQVTSPWVDGSVTVNRTKTVVTENIVVEVLGENTSELKANLKSLIEAFSQDYFRLYVVMNGTSSTYECESADYQIGWNGPRVIAGQVQVTFSVPRQPNALAGV